MTTQTYTRILTIVDCPHCGMSFGIPTDFEQRRRDDHASFYCPAKHSMSYGGKSEAEQLREERDRAIRDRDFARTGRQAARDQAEAAHRSASAHKGHATRLRNLIARGVCPVAGCRRNFADVRSHMATVHPDFHQHEGTGDTDG